MRPHWQTLDVDEIFAGVRRKEMTVGMHFFSPANVMPLLENIKGAHSSAETLATGISCRRTLCHVSTRQSGGAGGSKRSTRQEGPDAHVDPAMGVASRDPPSRCASVEAPELTAATCVNAAMDMGRRLHKTPVLAGNCFGFIGNRMFEVCLCRVCRAGRPIESICIMCHVEALAA